MQPAAVPPRGGELCADLVEGAFTHGDGELPGQINVMEALREVSPHTRMQIACSSEEYGMVYPNEVPDP